MTFEQLKKKYEGKFIARNMHFYNSAENVLFVMSVTLEGSEPTIEVVYIDQNFKICTYCDYQHSIKEWIQDHHIVT